MPTIYVLLCQKGKYYVGKTDRPLEERIEEHFTSNGSEWTKKYRPVEVIETKIGADDFDEDKYTKIYMRRYGINNVRGGSYVKINLPNESRLALEKELCSVSNLCFRCNQRGHFASDCKAKKTAKEIDDFEENDNPNSKGDDSNSDSDGIWCCDYCNKEFNSESKAESHEKLCKFNTRTTTTPGFMATALNMVAEALGEVKPTVRVSTRKPKPKCFKCGRVGHFAPDCFATKHVSGRVIKR
jgi:hypothetical protein